jgi:hypothetical protein
MKARLLFFALLASLLATAQRDPGGLECGTVGRSPWLNKYQAGLIEPVAKSNQVQYIPVRLNLLGRDGGGGEADPLTLMNSFRVLNADFAPLNIQFYIEGDIRYIGSTVFFDQEEEFRNDLFRDFNDTGVFNTYVTGSIPGLCGYYTRSFDAIVLSKNCINGGDRTWSHEVGHYFGLPHTFFGWESLPDTTTFDSRVDVAPDSLEFGNGFTVQVERADGSNCAESADGFCDTPADYLHFRWNCNSAGIYPDSLLDPDTVRFAVPGRNIMSYANDACVAEFTPEQQLAMQTNLDGRLGLGDVSPPPFAAARGEDLDLLFPEDRGTARFSDSVQLSWTSVENADFYIVQLNISPNFNGGVFASFITTDTTAAITEDLSPRRRYYWRVRPVNRYDVSGSFSETFQFRNGEFTVGTIDKQLDAAISVSPNPVSGARSLTLAGADIGNGTMDYALYDTGGRRLLHRGGIRVTGAGFREEIATNGLAAGVYFLRISVDGRMVTRRIVVTP